MQRADTAQPVSAPSLIVGLTGGIASGKSTVARRLAERGAAVIDADLIAREVVAPGEPALANIRQVFGERVMAADGTLDRAALAALVFDDPVALSRLNALTHPAILQRVGNRLLALSRAGHAWAVYEAALIVENQLAPGLDELVAVLCDPELQLQRLMARNALSPEAARARIASQADNAARREAATLVLSNDGSLDELLAATDALVATLSERYGPPGPPPVTPR